MRRGHTDFRPHVLLILSRHRLTRMNRDGWAGACVCCAWTYRGKDFHDTRVAHERHLADLFCEWLESREPSEGELVR